MVRSSSGPRILRSSFRLKRWSGRARLIVQLIYNAVGQEVFQDILGYQDGLLTDTRAELALRKEELSNRESELARP